MSQQAIEQIVREHWDACRARHAPKGADVRLTDREFARLIDPEFESMEEAPQDDIALATSAYLAGQQSVSAWIPTSERLPEQGANVLVKRRDREFPDNCLFVFSESENALVFFDSEFEWRLSEVTHWLPIPPLPEKGQGE